VTEELRITFEENPRRLRLELVSSDPTPLMLDDDDNMSP
jgi:hypothetical protein